jgi:UDP-GlcNAc:undecaprenyl-phosphate GlcNAc-1-phosphate transferase
VEVGTLTLLTGVIALVVAGLIGWFAPGIGGALGLFDFPDTDGGRKRHARITPLVGGTAVALSALAACGLTIWLLPLGPWVVQHIAWLALALGVMYLIGLADDRFALGAVIRLVLAIGTLLLVLVFAPDYSLGFLRFAGQSTVLPLGGWGDAFALLCLVGLLNAVNMADGKNGIILSLGLIWSLVLASRLPEPYLPLLGALAVSMAVMLVFNLRGRLFMGDGGSYVLSTLFGLLAISAYNQDFAVMRADDVAVMFAIPVFDTIRLMAMRAAHGRSPFEGDREHLHHYLHLHYGWPTGLIVYVALVALPNLGAVLLPGTGLAWLGISALLYVATLRIARQRRLPTAPT